MYSDISLQILSRLAGPVFVGLLVEGAGAVPAEVVERRLGQELLGVQLDEVLGVAQRDRDQRLQDRVDDVQYLKEEKVLVYCKCNLSLLHSMFRV